MVIFSLLLLASLLPHATCIVNGWEAKPHSRPYMVSVQEKEQHICGGFLISDRFVMTAASCQRRTQAVTVVLGAHNLRNKNENSVRIKVESYHPHPQYTVESYHNDILLLRLEKNARLNNNIKLISIPAKEGDIEADSVCSIAGWGLLETKGKQSNHLMETNVTVMNNKECECKWGEEEFSASLMMCVYGEGGSCDGDSGGPLVCGDTAVGVTSFGDPKICNSPDLPEVYTKISAYLTWIKSITAAHVKVGTVNSREAKPHSRPYMVSIQKNGQHICGGFLISDEFVFTAAHCHNKAQALTVVLGAHNLRNKNESSVRIKVESYYSHPQYTGKSFRNDILLLMLEKNAPVNNNIKPISIPAEECDIEDSVCSIAAHVNVGIVNGKEAKPHSRPYMVSVQSEEQHICSGFLISDRFVMTAAHCRNNSPVLTVVLGAHDLRKKNETLVRIKVDSYHQHPDYTNESFHNDILLLKLEKNAQLNNNIKSISISAEEGDIEADSVCSIAGWRLLETNGKQSNHLMETNVTVMNNMECESKWGKEEFSASLMMEILEALWFVETLQLVSLPLVTLISVIHQTYLKFILRFQHIFHG
ncbi:granzyme B(G,H)-like protein [Labeo rohita]|uniref:trypsin n=1 Tax=Labeo rohita TaxID=84645 RepID=A0A498NTR6_LABRO|nr:granzyme B(G,H)-like protein [Labeo rohita]